LDLETSGLSSGNDRILQIGLVKVTADGLEPRQAGPRSADRFSEWSTLVRLGWPLRSVGPTDIHGLRRRDLLTARSARSALLELRRNLRGLTPVAHNADFDAKFLANAARRHGVDLGIERMLCTLRLARALDPERTHSHRLAALCERYGIDHQRPHDALEDARATALLLPRLIAAAPDDVLSSPDIWVDFPTPARGHQVVW
jgi:DNA polymerase-3 subunit epsilon